MIIQSGILLLIFLSCSHCWVIGPALALTEYSKRLQLAQQERSAKQIETLPETSSLVNKTKSVELKTTIEAIKVHETTSEPATNKNLTAGHEEKKWYF